jgi:hypothetical protein
VVPIALHLPALPHRCGGGRRLIRRGRPKRTVWEC